MIKTAITLAKVAAVVSAFCAVIAAFGACVILVKLFWLAVRQ